MKYRYTVEELKRFPEAVQKRIPEMRKWTNEINSLKGRSEKPRTYSAHVAILELHDLSTPMFHFQTYIFSLHYINVYT
jgi:hypothetical protein